LKKDAVYHLRGFKKKEGHRSILYKVSGGGAIKQKPTSAERAAKRATSKFGGGGKRRLKQGEEEGIRGAQGKGRRVRAKDQTSTVPYQASYGGEEKKRRHTLPLCSRIRHYAGIVTKKAAGGSKRENNVVPNWTKKHRE